ncbi:hypothetical protein RHGRI_026069 [Rhododendron griersonianum]|uniref:BED-type domain-containing protein n=1 Tax=Rhododendron griersonianum TaxID=479676 RepID=A0AAV6IRB4_9ERIC|nr:hypothetical protein RHGRI_026069 [Rhododendron griersonianum]
MDFSRAQAAQSYSESSDEGHEARASGNSVGEGASNSVPANPASTSIGNRGKKRAKRANTSWVWNHMSKRKDVTDAKGVNIGKRSCCNYCDKNYSPDSNYGTGNMIKHLTKHHQDKIGNEHRKDFSNFIYSKAEMRKGLARYVAAAEQPFTFGDDVRFEHFVQQKLNPVFKKVSRNTTRADTLAEFKVDKEQFINEEIAGFPRGTSVSFTSDMWSGGNNRGYMALTAHYIDSSWKLNKRIIAFRLVEYPHNSTTIFQTVYGVFTEYNLADKVFSITFDNHSANTASIDMFLDNLSPIHGGKLFHMRCVCHIINLVVQDGLKTISLELSKIKDAIHFITTSPSRQQEFDAFCASLSLKPKVFNTDIRTRWNSTYIMLKSCKNYYKAISDFVNPRYGGGFLLSIADWNLAFEFMKFLKVFYTATCACSGVRYPTSCIVLHQLFNISVFFRTYRLRENFVHPLVKMEDKFKKYFEPMPKIFVFAVVMDPRIKLCGVDRLLKGLSTNMGVLFYSIATVKKDLIDLYDLYESKYASTNVASTCPDPCLPRSSVDDPGWSLMSDDASDIFDFDTDTADTSARSELSIYLETERIKITNNQQNFDILGWWQQHAPTFPVLNIMARDLLTPPVSSVPSESAFSAGERVLDDKRSRLAPDILDCLMCLKDWEDTRLGIHPRAAKDELRDYFADSDIDDE